jgi:prefoldin subunit 5
MSRTTLEKIADREQEVAAAVDQVRAQIEQFTARLAELDAEAVDLATARKVVFGLGEDEPSPLKLPGLPDNPAYQRILTVLT